MAFNFVADANGQPQTDPSSGLGQLDPITMQKMFQALPAIQQAQRRAQQLRDVQQGFQALSKEPGNGNYQPTQKGGLYQTVAKWMPDYKQMGNQAVGALGNYFTNQQANSAEDTYNQQRNQQILQGIQQASSGNSGSLFGGNGVFGGGNLWAGTGSGT